MFRDVGRNFLIPTLSKHGLSKKRICAKGIPSGNPSALFKYTLSVWSWDQLIMKTGLADHLGKGILLSNFDEAIVLSIWTLNGLALQTRAIVG